MRLNYAPGAFISLRRLSEGRHATYLGSATNASMTAMAPPAITLITNLGWIHHSTRPWTCRTDSAGASRNHSKLDKSSDSCASVRSVDLSSCQFGTHARRSPQDITWHTTAVMNLTIGPLRRKCSSRAHVTRTRACFQRHRTYARFTL